MQPSATRGETSGLVRGASGQSRRFAPHPHVRTAHIVNSIRADGGVTKRDFRDRDAQKLANGWV